MFLLAKHLGRKKKTSGMAKTGLTLVSSCNVIARIIHGLEKRDLFVRGPIVNLPPPCGEKLLSLVTVRKEEYNLKNKGV